MKRGGIRLMGGLSVAALSTAFASSCSSPPRTPSASAPLSTYAAPSPLPTGRIAQMEFGRRAAFAQCVSPACPAVTPKTLAMEPPAGPATLSSGNPGSSLTAGEAFVTSGGAPSPLAAPGVTLSSAATAAKSTRQVIVHFGFGDASLTATARAQIDEVAASLPSAVRIAISGRTDSVGSPQSNQTLAVARANAVRDHLRTRYPHLAPAVTLEAKGACCFAASNDTQQGRALNRRVEIVFERDAEDL
ncbi:MAG: OmpA family protein [Burkholderiaceae bacterium]|nr:OmpA family protein [Burkholderiaceae bacterium]